MKGQRAGARGWGVAVGAVAIGWWLLRGKRVDGDEERPVPDLGVNPPVEIHGVGSRSLTAFEKWALSPFIPRVDLENARLHVGELPFWARWAIQPRAITLGNDIYFAKEQHFVSSAGLALIAHELVHVGQYRRGMTRLGYLWTQREGYSHDNEYEKPAYEMNRRIMTEMPARLRGIDFGV